MGRAPFLRGLRLVALLAAVLPPASWAARGQAPALPAGPIVDDAPTCDGGQPGSLTLNTMPWTMVAVDGVLVGTTPLFRLPLAPGPHRLTLVNDRQGVNASEDVVIAEGRAHKLKLLLAVTDTETLLQGDSAGADVDCVDDADAGFVSVQTQPWSKVWLNGALIGVTPLFQHRVRAGTQALRFLGRDGQVFATRVLVTRGEVLKVAVALPPGESLEPR